METIENILEGIASSGFNDAVTMTVGGKRLVLPKPSPLQENPKVMRSEAIFPDGAPAVTDFLTVIESNPLAHLSPPLNALGGIALDKMSVDFDGSNTACRVAFEFAFPDSIQIGFQEAKVTAIRLAASIDLPLDPLRTVNMIASGELTLDGFPVQTAITSEGHVSLLLNDGNVIDCGPLLKRIKSGGLDISFPLPTLPQLKNVLVEFDLPADNLRVFAEMANASVDILGLTVSVNSFHAILGSQKFACLEASATAGGLFIFGLAEIPGDMELKAHIPKCKPAQLVATVFPALAPATSIVKDIEFPSADIALVKSDANDSILLSTSMSVASFLPEGVVKFADHIGLSLSSADVAAEVLLANNPTLARFRFALCPEARPLIGGSDFGLDGLWLQADLQDASPVMGLVADISFTFHGQHFKLEGTILAGINEADINARQVEPEVWTNALGIQGLNLSNLNLAVSMSYEGVPGIGFGGGFNVQVPHTNNTFTGEVEFLFDPGNPATSVFSAAFSHFDLREAFHLMLPSRDASLDNLLKQVSFGSCKLYFSPAGNIIAGVAYPAGFCFRGEFDLFGWSESVDVMVDPALGICFCCDMGKAVKVGHIIDLASKDKPGKGPHLSFTTYPAEKEPFLSVDGTIAIANAFSAATSITFDTTHFFLAFTAKFFKIDGVSFNAEAEFAHLASGDFEVTVSLQNLGNIESNLNSSLKAAAKKASDAISAAQQKVEQAEKNLAPIKSAYEERQKVLNDLISKRNHASIVKKAYYEAQIVVVQGEVTTLQGSCLAAQGTLNAAVGALGGVKTAENCALNGIAGFIESVPVKLDSLTCSEKVTALDNSRFSASVAAEVNHARHMLQVTLDFNADKMLEILATDLESAIVNLFK